MAKLINRTTTILGELLRRVRQESRRSGAALTSADSAILDDLDTLMAQSRAAIRNDGFTLNSNLQWCANAAAVPPPGPAAPQQDSGIAASRGSVSVRFHFFERSKA